MRNTKASSIIAPTNRTVKPTKSKIERPMNSAPAACNTPMTMSENDHAYVTSLTISGSSTSPDVRGQIQLNRGDEGRLRPKACDKSKTMAATMGTAEAMSEVSANVGIEIFFEFNSFSDDRVGAVITGSNSNVLVRMSLVTLPRSVRGVD
jgi:hypothetical protein